MDKGDGAAVGSFITISVVAVGATTGGVGEGGGAGGGVAACGWELRSGNDSSAGESCSTTAEPADV